MVFDLGALMLGPRRGGEEMWFCLATLDTGVGEDPVIWIVRVVVGITEVGDDYVPRSMVARTLRSCFSFPSISFYIRKYLPKNAVRRRCA